MESEQNSSAAEADRETLIDMLGSIEAFSKVLPLVLKNQAENTSD